MEAAEVDTRYLMFVLVDDEKAIKKKAEELAQSIMREFYLYEYGFLNEDEL